MKAIVFDCIGSPLEVLRLAEVGIPEIGPGQVLVRLRAASINPGDFLFIQGLYPDPKKPLLPQIGGQHGAGVIVRSGPGVSIVPGTFVAFSHQNVWAEYVVVPVEWLVPLPPDYPLEKAGQLMNLITAWDLLERVQVASGQWLALTAGNSTVSTMVSQMARRRGVNVVSIVRRTRLGLHLEGLGAAAVIDLAQARGGLRERLAELTGKQGLAALIDCAGGPPTGDLIRALGWGGRAVLYGGYSPEPFALHNFDVLMSDVRISAYVYRYFFDPPRKGDAGELARLIQETAADAFVVRNGGMHPLDDFETAIRESWEHPEAGKRFFVLR